MELSPWTVYWITRLDTINVMLGVLVALSVGWLVMLLLAFAFQTPEAASANEEALDRAFRRGSWIALAFIATFSLIPSTKEMAAILVIPAVVNNEDVQEFGGEFVELAREWMRELRPEQEGE